MKKILSLSLLISLLFFGCAYKRAVEKSQSYLFTIKMKNIAFSDMGFLNIGKDFVDLQLFDAGNLVFELKISNYICVNGHCFSKEEFNEKFLSKTYPLDTLERILRGKTIFQKRDLNRKEDGFSQNIKEKDLYIKYFVSKNKIYFKDYKNHILIKLINVGS